MQILKMHNLTQNYRINLAARGILQSHGTLRHMTVESNNGITPDGTQIPEPSQNTSNTGQPGACPVDRTA